MISADEGFGAVLFAVAVPGGEALSALALTGRLGRAEGAAFSAEFRWVVESGGALYVSNATFDLPVTTLTGASLPDVDATTWALWNPAANIADLKFSSVAATFGTVALSAVTKVGYLYEMSDTDSSSVSWHELSAFTATTVAGAPMPPVISSAATAAGNRNLAFSYQITATQSPTSYAVTGALPAGLSLNTSTGLISGMPTTEEVKNVTISATNASGTGNAALQISIGPELPLPQFTSPGSAALAAGGSFAYQATVTNGPATFSAMGLPAGLTLDAATGRISGQVFIAGTYAITLTATNAAGSQQTTLNITFGTYTPAVPVPRLSHAALRCRARRPSRAREQYPRHPGGRSHGGTRPPHPPRPAPWHRDLSSSRRGLLRRRASRGADYFQLHLPARPACELGRCLHRRAGHQNHLLR